MALDNESNSIPPSTEQTEEQLATTRAQFSIWHTFKHHIPRLIITILVDLVLPLVIYFILQKHMKPVFALLAASSPPLVMVVSKAIWLRTFDALGFLIFLAFVSSAIVALITRNAIILLLEKSLITAIVSLVFGVTLIPFNCCHHRCEIRPLAFYFYKDLVPTGREDVGLPACVFVDEREQIDSRYTELREEDTTVTLSEKQEVAQVYEWIYAHCPSFRLSCYLISIIWSAGLMTEFLARLALILAHLPVNLIVIYGHIILSSLTVTCVVLSLICLTIERKRTLAYIERWKAEHLNSNSQQRPPENSPPDIVLRIDF